MSYLVAKMAVIVTSDRKLGGFTLCRELVYQLRGLIIQWDFQGPPIMGPPYGKLPILFPYHSHKNP